MAHAGKTTVTAIRFEMLGSFPWRSPYRRSLTRPNPKPPWAHDVPMPRRPNTDLHGADRHSRAARALVGFVSLRTWPPRFLHDAVPTWRSQSLRWNSSPALLGRSSGRRPRADLGDLRCRSRCRDRSSFTRPGSLSTSGLGRAAGANSAEPRHPRRKPGRPCSGMVGILGRRRRSGLRAGGRRARRSLSLSFPPEAVLDGHGGRTSSSRRRPSRFGNRRWRGPCYGMSSMSMPGQLSLEQLARAWITCPEPRRPRSSSCLPSLPSAMNILQDRAARHLLVLFDDKDVGRPSPAASPAQSRAPLSVWHLGVEGRR